MEYGMTLSQQIDSNTTKEPKDELGFYHAKVFVVSISITPLGELFIIYRIEYQGRVFLGTSDGGILRIPGLPPRGWKRNKDSVECRL